MKKARCRGGGWPAGEADEMQERTTRAAIGGHAPWRWEESTPAERGQQSTVESIILGRESIGGS